MWKLLAIALVATPVAAVAAEQKKDQRERRVCKRDMTTGSLVQAKRICLTKEDWRRTQEHNRRNVEEWQEEIDGAQRNG